MVKAVPIDDIENISLIGQLNDIKNRALEDGLAGKEPIEYYWRRLTDCLSDWASESKDYDLYNTLCDILAGIGEDGDVVIIPAVTDLIKDVL